MSRADEKAARSPKAVILIPTFNSATFIAETLDSLERQDVPNERLPQVVVADDGSTDHTLDVIRARPRGRLDTTITNAGKNAGERANVNRAFSVLRDNFDWVLILHSDDLAKPHWLTTMLDRVDACADTVASVCSSWDNLMPDGTIVPGEDNPSRAVEVIPGELDAVRGTLRKGCWWHISGCAIRTRAFDRVGGFDATMPQIGDLDWLLRCLGAGWSIEYVPRTLIKYRQHAQSVSTASMRASRDILEALTLVQRHATELSSRQVIAFHLRQGQAVVRRLARSISRGQVRRATHLIGVLGRVGANAWTTLNQRPQLPAGALCSPAAAGGPLVRAGMGTDRIVRTEDRPPQ